jgi:hypothetical protein
VVVVLLLLFDELMRGCANLLLRVLRTGQQRNAGWPVGLVFAFQNNVVVFVHQLSVAVL